MDCENRAREVVDIEIEGLRKVRAAIGCGFRKAVDLLLDCLKKRGKIVVTGIGKNLHIAQKVSATLASTGSTSVVLNPVQAMHGDLGVLSTGDALLILSYSGASEEIIGLIPLVKRTGVVIVSITGNPDSPLALHSDAVIDASVDREACPFNMAPTASTTAALAIGDALAMILLEARGFRKEDYAMLHPGGTIGRSLLMKASDIMRTGDRLATVSADTGVREAVLAMTGARAGSALVVDSNHRLIGLVSDGDLRRHLARDPETLSRKVSDIMTRSPVTVRDTQLAAEVLRLYEQQNIDDMPVVDANGRLVGSIDIQDLPKLKIL